jgi:hypothetical protein
MPDFAKSGMTGAAAESFVEKGPVTDIDGDDGPFFKVPIEDPVPPSLPPATKTAFENFNTAVNWLKAIGVAIGIGITVAMTVDLVRHWDDYNTTGK